MNRKPAPSLWLDASKLVFGWNKSDRGNHVIAINDVDLHNYLSLAPPPHWVASL